MPVGTTQAWLIPLGAQEFTALRGERGYFFAADGRTMEAEVGTSARFRAAMLPDTGVVPIEVPGYGLPLLSRMVMLNLLHSAGRETCF